MDQIQENFQIDGGTKQPTEGWKDRKTERQTDPNS